MAKPKSPGDRRGPKAKAKGGTAASGWAALTWEALESWAGVRGVSRGRTYQRGGRVKDLKVSEDGDLLATVQGTERYATTVALEPGRSPPVLESSCTCPVGFRCKHAVAVVADYLQALADERIVPVASDDDPRWGELDGRGADPDDDGDDGDDDWDEDDGYPVRKVSTRKAVPRRQAAAVDWDAKIEARIRAQTKGELADLAWSLVRRFPEVYKEFRERISLQEGNVDELLVEARREIRKVTSESAWQNHWDNNGHIPNYNPIRHRLERLLDLGHADAVVALGRDLIARGMRQVGESHDEGETATALGECLAVVFRAVTRSSLSGPDRLLFAIDALLADDCSVLDDVTNAVLDAEVDPEDWSVVADTLIKRLKTYPSKAKGDVDRFSRDYQRDRITGWVATALENADRKDELRTLYESEARATKSYERIVSYLLEEQQFDDAERWAREGIAATAADLPGIAAGLATKLGEVAQNRKQWDVVAAHAAHKFFSHHPSASSFDDLMKAAKKAGVEGPIRAAALRFLETGAAPYQVVSPPARVVPATRGRRAATSAASARDVASALEMAASSKDRVMIDTSWPLPVPDYLVPLLHRPRRYDSGPRPHLDVLLGMAIAAKKPDEVLRWYDRMRSQTPRSPYGMGVSGYADRVAVAVSTAYPERAVEIYLAALNAQLPHAQVSSYENATAYLRKLRPLYESLDRGGEWIALLTSIREKYRNRPRFMDLLDGLEGRTIVEASKAKRK